MGGAYEPGAYVTGPTMGPAVGPAAEWDPASKERRVLLGRGLHSSAFQLNLSRF
jgi:hypothetical protein